MPDKTRENKAQRVVLKMLSCDISLDSSGVCDRVVEWPQLLSNAAANSMGSQGIEPWASRVLSRRDTTTPTALAILLRCETPTFYGPTHGFLATFPNQFMMQKTPHRESGVRGDFLPENLSTSGIFRVLGHRMPFSSPIPKKKNHS